MLKKIGSFAFLSILVIAFMLVQTTNVHAEKSTFGKVGNGNEETPGEWIIYDTPPNLQEDAPILLFVPGLNNVAQIFWEVNHSMAEAAYQAGYQAVFIQLNDAGGQSADMWDNGQLLANKIEEISNHFDGKPITVIAYSKGGVDTQTALTYYGVSHLVDNVITLSSPHHGSELANLAYSSGAGWLADLIGAQGEGTYAMQTGYMEDFRHQTDQHANAYANSYYTLGGTDWGRMFSANWFGGMYLSSYGSNDGVVTVASSRLPGGQEIAVGDWNHTSIRTGVTFPVFEQHISSQSTFDKQESVSRNEELKANHWVDGGQLERNVPFEVPIAVEEKVNKMTYNVLTSNPLAEMTLVDPYNKESHPKYESVKIDEGVFVGAYVHTFEVEKPEAGTWELRLHSEENDAYLLIVDYETSNKFELKQEADQKLSQKRLFEITNVPDQVNVDSLKATYHIMNTKEKDEEHVLTVWGKSALNQSLTFDKSDTVYNITINLEGWTKEGEKITRTFIESVYVR